MPTVIVDAFVDVTELTGAVSDRAQDPGLVAVPHKEEELQRLCVTSFLANPSGEIKIVIAQSRRSSINASLCGAIPASPAPQLVLTQRPLLPLYLLPLGQEFEPKSSVSSFAWTGDTATAKPNKTVAAVIAIVRPISHS